MPITHRTIETNGIRIRLAEAGTGPLVLLCHGFPESWYSWRHQLTALANAGYHAVAPDMRGYGGTDAPEDTAAYTLLHLTGDMIGVLDALGERQAVIVGHDWGGPVAWHAALFRPDRFRGVVGLSVPFRPRGPQRPSTVMPQTPETWFYQQYFQAPGVAESELERDVRRSIRDTLFALSGDNDPSRIPSLCLLPRSGGWLDGKAAPATLPAWLSEADVDTFTAEFKRTGFRGGLSWYRNIDRTWELLGPWAGAKVMVPALYVTGDRDVVYHFRGMDQLVPNLKQFVPNLTKTVVLPGCGHWTQQERPAEVNALLIEFLRGLDGR